MSAVEHRSIARLPLEIFKDLQRNDEDAHTEWPLLPEWPLSPEELRREIVTKLKSTTIRKYRNNNNNNDNNLQQGQPPLHPENPQQPQQPQPQHCYESVTTVGALLRLSPTSLLRALDPLLTYPECREFRRRTCLATAPGPVTALDLWRRRGREELVPTGLRRLDAHLRGGLRPGTLAEVVGRAGVGKTQLALQAACRLAVAGGGEGARTVYVDAEGKSPLPRLQEMAGSSSAAVLSRVSLHSPSDLMELRTLLSRLEDEILEHHGTAAPVGLLVIDSIAAPTRRHEFGSAALRAAAILQIAQTVKRLADQFQLVALVINQVASASPSSADPSNTQHQTTTKAALGTAWHHCVSTRVQLALTTDDQGAVVARHAAVVKSNMVGPSHPLEFRVTTRGLVDI